MPQILKMKKGEKALVTVDGVHAETAFPWGGGGGGKVEFEITLSRWVNVDDVSAGKDGSVLKRIVTEGSGWEKPKTPYEIIATITATNGGGVFYDSGGDKLFKLGAAELPAAVELAAATMKKGEVAKVTASGAAAACAGGGFENAGEEAEYLIDLRGWHKIEDVTNDGGVVIKFLNEGDGWKKPSDGSSVTRNEFHLFVNSRVSFTATTANGVVVASASEQVMALGDSEQSKGSLF